MKIGNQRKGITLIALVITIIVLLLLAGVTMAILTGENGVLTNAQWARWVTEYSRVEEAERMYEFVEETKKYGKLEKITSRATEQRGQTQGTKYAITNEKIEIQRGSSLENVIKQTQGDDYTAELYKLDLGKLNLVGIKSEYAIDIKNGKIYDIEGHKKREIIYHIPEIGININAKDTQAPNDFEIAAVYNEETKEIEITVGEVTDNVSTKFEYEYHIYKVTINEETGETSRVDSNEIIERSENNTYSRGSLEDGIYEIYVMVYDEEKNSKKSDEKIVGIDTKVIDTEAPNDFEISAAYSEDEEQLQVKVGQVTDNVSTIFEYEYHIQEVQMDVETGEITKTESAEIVEKSANNTYSNDTIASGTYQVYATVYDEAKNSKKSPEQIVVVEKPDVVTNTSGITIEPVVVTIGKSVTIQALKNADTDEPEKVSNTSFTFSIVDESIATVNSKGKITGVSEGETTLKVTLKSDTTKTLNVTVSVKDLITEIWTKSDLEQFRDEVNSGSTYSGLEVMQMANIDLKDENWTPIGTSTKTFKGTYNGNNKKITGLYINATTERQGLFGTVNGNAVIKNVNIEDGYIYTTKWGAGGIVGWANYITVDNCTFSGSVTTTGRYNTDLNWGATGGIIGCALYSSTNEIKNCKNYGTINGTWHHAGGIAGACFAGKIKNCENHGEITGTRACIGGITGQIGIHNSDLKKYTYTNMSDCTNYGNITASGTNAYQVGGITGVVNNNSTVYYSENKGAVICEGRQSADYLRSVAGGIAGTMSSNGAQKKIVGCTNNGTVTASYNQCGGIVGWGQNGTIENCTNNYAITGKTNVGGIAASAGRYDTDYKTSVTISKCINNGQIKNTAAGNFNIGGIVGGLNNSFVENCGNTGNIIAVGKSSADSYARAGGICGITDTNPKSITNCYNTGNVTSTYKGAGGIIGYVKGANATITYCYNTGTVTAPTVAGGIVGYYASGTVENNYYLQNSVSITSGSVTAKGEAVSSSSIKALVSTATWKNFLVNDKTPNINKGYPIFSWQ